MERRITNRGGAVAFIDDHTAWVVGKGAEENITGIREIVDHALAWELRSGATFEGEKTALVHFTRNSRLQSSSPINIKGTEILPCAGTKILGVLMDSELRYKNHFKRVSCKGLKAALALKRLRALIPFAARQLFGATVAPVVDYASSGWMHSIGASALKTIRQILKIGSQAITGAFSSVAGAIAEAEAYISPVKARQQNRAAKLLINLFTLPASHPISRLNLQPYRKFKSPLQRIRTQFPGICKEEMEKIEPYIIPPWEPRISYDKYTPIDNVDTAEGFLHEDRLLIVTTAVTNKYGIAYGIAQASRYACIATGTRLESRKTQNLYTTELQAIAATLNMAEVRLPSNLSILVTTSSLTVLQVLNNPARQSGQCAIKSIYKSKKEIERKAIKDTMAMGPNRRPILC